jgi:ribosome-binding factor A
MEMSLLIDQANATRAADAEPDVKPEVNQKTASDPDAEQSA